MVIDTACQARPHQACMARLRGTLRCGEDADAGYVMQVGLPLVQNVLQFSLSSGQGLLYMAQCHGQVIWQRKCPDMLVTRNMVRVGRDCKTTCLSCSSGLQENCSTTKAPSYPRCSRLLEAELAIFVFWLQVRALLCLPRYLRVSVPICWIVMCALWCHPHMSSASCRAFKPDRPDSSSEWILAKLRAEMVHVKRGIRFSKQFGFVRGHVVMQHAQKRIECVGPVCAM